MKKIFFILMLLVHVASQSQSTVSQNLGDFTTLKVFNGIEVELIKSNEQKIEIRGKKSEKVTIKNVDKTLKLTLPFSLKPENNSADGEVIVKLFYSSNIDVIDANEGATITGKDINQEKLVVNSQERALINLVVNTKYIEVKTSSGGIIKLSGTTKHQDVNLDLYGVYHGFNLKTENTSTVKAGTGAKAEIFAGETLTAKVSFGGSIFYKGNPELIKDKKVIGGIIQKRN
ncbi:head GIN domain-containing protein [Polaribacter marinivivus]|uniref:head GIN domain-containing protein n=1 Tax=Polaribacter TaxID=52959 RepID=UPI0026059F8F|nr:head GIN domain-containing protein [uncultured Polaribacter sp.]